MLQGAERIQGRLKRATTIVWSPSYRHSTSPPGSSRQVGVGAGSGLESLADRPGLAIVVADLDGKVLAWSTSARNLISGWIAGEGMGIGENQRAGPGGMRRDAGHANRFPKLVVEDGCAPTGGPVGTHRDQLAIRVRNAAADQHHSIVGESRDHRFVGIAKVALVRHGNLSGMPGLAMIVAVDRGRCRRFVVARVAVSQPDGDDQSPAVELNPVTGSGGDDFPVIVLAKWLEGRGDFHRLTPAHSVVDTPHRETPCIVDAVQKLDRARLAVDDGDRIVHCLLALPSLRLSRIAFDPLADVSDLLCRIPSHSAVGAAAQMDLDLTPVRPAVLASLAVGQHRTLGRHDDARNAIQRHSVHAGRKNVGLRKF